MEEFVDGKKIDRGAAETKQLWRGTRGRMMLALIFALWRGNAVVSRSSNERRLLGQDGARRGQARKW